MEKLLRTLLEDLEAIEQEHGEVTDTEVRDAMRHPIHDGFINPQPGFVLGTDFGMLTPEGNEKVRAALNRFLKRAGEVAKAEGLNTPRARLDAFQNIEVASAGGCYYDDFFGYVPEPW
jgi:hypothetical protein